MENMGLANRLTSTTTSMVDEFKKGETYTFTVSGRSGRFDIDRILFSHESVSGGPMEPAELRHLPESALMDKRKGTRPWSTRGQQRLEEGG